MRNQFDDSTTSYSSEQEEERTASNGGASGIRAVVLFVLSVAIFIFAVAMSLYLIRQSGLVEPQATDVSEVKPLEYEINVPPTQLVTQGEGDPYQLDLKEPESSYASPVINILLLVVEGDRNDTQILCSVNLAERSLSMISIPRDTYVAGDYKVPKARNIYASYEKSKGVAAVKDAVRGMMGFAPDYYFVLDQATLTEALALINGLSFDVPESPAYHSLKSGTQTLDGKSAFELFRFKDSWKEVETDPPRVQRTFLLSLIDALLADKNRISEISVKLSQIADTDLSVEELAYLGFLLADFDFENAFSRALPGEEKEIEKETYYEVDPEKAVELLNEHFNPLQKELTVFSVNFRQEQGASGDGEYSDYGFSSSTEETDGDGSGEDGDSDEGEDGDSDGEQDPNEDEDPPTEQEATEAPDNGGDSDNGTT